MSGLDLEKTVMAAAYTGVAQSTMDEMLAYAKERISSTVRSATFRHSHIRWSICRPR